jgi:hypothetical protein
MLVEGLAELAAMTLSGLKEQELDFGPYLSPPAKASSTWHCIFPGFWQCLK